MQTKSFLPDDKPVYCHIMARLHYPREILEKFIAGTGTSDFPMMEHTDPLWGLLYVSDTGIGFFVHPSEGAMAALLRATTDKSAPAPLNFSVPYDRITGIEIVHPREPKTIFGKIVSRFTAKEDSIFIVNWNGGGQNGGPSCTLRFFIMQDCTDFERELGKYVKALTIH